jgi:glucuronoarabinoxylan endo-1,4-beta-xylanase
MKKAILLLTGIILYMMMAYPQGVITIDASKQYQTIEGLGGMSHFAGGHTFSDAYITQLIDNLGCTVFRNETQEDYVTSLADLNSNTVNNGAGTVFDMNVQFANKIKAKGQHLVISTTWSPPRFMKQNNCNMQKTVTCGGSCGSYNCPDSTNYLKPSEYANYAKFLELYCKDYKTKTGFDLYALGIQNEPMFNEPYNSALMYAPQFSACLKIVGSYFAADPALSGIKFYGAEHMCNYADNNSTNENRKYIPYLLDDSATRQYMHAFAVHGYVDGISLDIGTAGDYTFFAQKTDSYNKRMWMTETVFASTNWKDYMNSGKGLFLALKYGHVSLWSYWVLEDNLYASGFPDGRTAVAKQFFRFIRPGLVQVDAADATSNLISMAFKKGSNWTIMILNTGSADQTITLTAAAGTTLPASFQRYQSTANNYCSYLGKTISNTLIIPDSSITTLYYNDSLPDVQWSNNPPQNVQITNLTETSAKLTWTAAPAWTVNTLPTNYNLNTNGYYVYSKEKNGDWTKLSPTAQPTLNYNITTGLKPGYKYTYGVMARDEMYNLSAIVEVTFRTPCTSSCPDTTDIPVVEDPSISVYPNPTDDVVTVCGAAQSMVVILDMNGKCIVSQECLKNEETINLNNVPQGMYLIKIIKNNRVVVKKIFVR